MIRCCLVTGGAGFIGCNLADRLLRDGHTVTLFDSLARPGAELNLAWLRERHGERLRFIRGDVRSAEAVSAVVAEAQVVYHLAGQTAVTTSVADPRGDFAANLVGTLNVLEAARCSQEPPIVVYASSNKVYGSMSDEEIVETPTRYAFRDLPRGVSEQHPLAFESPYGCSKGASDQYVLAYGRLYDLPTIVFRQSCIYGPRQMGIEDQGWVAWFILAAALRREITIFGSGKQVRDLLYVDDLLDAYELAVRAIDRTRGRAFNIGGGAPFTISVWAEFAPVLETVVGRSPRVRFDEARPGDQQVFFCDTGRAERLFGWQPSTPVEEGVGRLADWILDNRSSLERIVPVPAE